MRNVNQTSNMHRYESKDSGTGRKYLSLWDDLLETAHYAHKNQRKELGADHVVCMCIYLHMYVLNEF